MNWLFLVIGLFIGALTAVAVVTACVIGSKGNPPTNWRGEEPYDE